MDQQRASKIVEYGNKIIYYYGELDRIHNLLARSTIDCKVILCLSVDDYPRVDVAGDTFLKEDNVLPIILDVLRRHCETSIEKYEQGISNLVKKE